MNLPFSSLTRPFFTRLFLVITIIGVVSPTIPNAGHAVLWDGEKIIDPGFCERVDRSYVDRCGLEFTQRACDLEPLIRHEIQISYRAGAVAANEPL